MKNAKCKIEALCAAWNERYPVGTVIYLRRDGGKVLKTAVRGAAVEMNGMAVAWFAGVAGCYLIERAFSIEEEVPA